MHSDFSLKRYLQLIDMGGLKLPRAIGGTDIQQYNGSRLKLFYFMCSVVVVMASSIISCCCQEKAQENCHYYL